MICSLEETLVNILPMGKKTEGLFDEIILREKHEACRL
jgi:hypothetical protein